MVFVFTFCNNSILSRVNGTDFLLIPVSGSSFLNVSAYVIVTMMDLFWAVLELAVTLLLLRCCKHTAW